MIYQNGQYCLSFGSFFFKLSLSLSLSLFSYGKIENINFIYENDIKFAIITFLNFKSAFEANKTEIRYLNNDILLLTALYEPGECVPKCLIDALKTLNNQQSSSTTTANDFNNINVNKTTNKIVNNQLSDNLNQNNDDIKKFVDLYKNNLL